MEKKRKLYIEALGIVQAANKLSLEERGYSRSEEANALIFSDPFAFVVGLIFDQSIQSALAWEAPLHLKERLGHFDVRKIASMDKEKLKQIIAQKKSLHRYPGNMAKYLIESCSGLVSNFDSRSENLWKGVETITETRKNFLRLSGIGEKKANLAILMLARDFDIHFTDIGTLQLALDVHLKRVLSRSGLFVIDTSAGLKDLQNCFQDNYPHFPALLGTALWFVGRHFCHETSPECDTCPLNSTCLRRLL
ncbi:MAG: hypothetical protein Q8Q48_04460 [Candidatus Staskawiczbacteria bacterium]|nr:hypothetical protein [Candidatus Staskawiczbacteria bacterium]